MYHSLDFSQGDRVCKVVCKATSGVVPGEGAIREGKMEEGDTRAVITINLSITVSALPTA
jgi:hypothetical protein